MGKTADALAIKEAIRKRDGHRCVLCGLKQEDLVIGKEFAQHAILKKLHVHRVIADGPYTFENCMTLCPSCHCKQRRDYTGEMPRKPKRTMSRSDIKIVLEALNMSDEELASYFGGDAANRLFHSYDEGVNFYPHEEEADVLKELLPECKDRIRERTKQWLAGVMAYCKSKAKQKAMVA